jgi:hypothetical protein
MMKDRALIKSRRTYVLNQGTGDVLHKTVILSIDCIFETYESDLARQYLLEQLLQNPQLGECGPKMFESLELKHDGERWSMTLKALEKKGHTF